MLTISGEKDHAVRRTISDATFRSRRRWEGVTEFIELPNRGHALTMESGSHEVATTALGLVKRFVQLTPNSGGRLATHPEISCQEDKNRIVASMAWKFLGVAK